MKIAALVVTLLFFVGFTQKKKTAGTSSFRDRYFEIESGRPRRPERPNRPSSRPAEKVELATSVPAVEIVPGTTEEIRIIRVLDTERIDAARSLRFSLLGIRGFSRSRIQPLGETYGYLAYIVTKGLMEGKRVVVEYDKGSRPVNGRTPVYFFLPDGRFLNRILVENGLGLVEDASETLKYRAALQKAQKSAQRRGVGYWTRNVTDSLDNSK